MPIELDAEKDRANIAKHGISLARQRISKSSPSSKMTEATTAKPAIAHGA